MGIAIWAVLLIGCAGEGETGAVLPPEDTFAWAGEGEGTELPFDSGLVGPTDEVPAHTLVLHQWGAWPWPVPAEGGAGELFVREYPDGVRPPEPDTGDTGAARDTGEPAEPLACDLAFALALAPSEAATCDGCGLAWEVSFEGISGDPGGCHDPELPADGDLWRLAAEPAAGLIWRDLGGIGVWVPWFNAAVEGDLLTFAWETSVAVHVEEDDR